ncbi:MAG: hypothetical protein CMQ39_07390 [Gammaproteobacteria bacterium]|nr:hypothetical protein [Gammaproteobacteria bacterium]
MILAHLTDFLNLRKKVVKTKTIFFQTAFRGRGSINKPDCCTISFQTATRLGGVRLIGVN